MDAVRTNVRREGWVTREEMAARAAEWKRQKERKAARRAARAVRISSLAFNPIRGLVEALAEGRL